MTDSEPSLTVGLLHRSESTRSLPLAVLPHTDVGSLLRLLTLTKPTIPTKITATRMFQLTRALGAFADHCGHDRSRDLSSIGALLFAEGPGGIGVAFQAPVGDHDAFGDGLFGRGEQALVEPDGVGAGDFVQAVADFRGIESAAQHLRSQHAYAAPDGPGGKDFRNHLVVVVYCHVKILAVERNAPGGADEFTRTLETNRAHLARRCFCFRQTPCGRFIFRFSADGNRLFPSFHDSRGSYDSGVFGLSLLLHRSKHLVLARAVAVVAHGLAAKLSGQAIEMID